MMRDAHDTAPSAWQMEVTPVTGLPLPLTSRLTLADDGAYVSQWQPDLADSGCYILEIDAADVHDRASFFERTYAGLKVSRPAGAVDKWSAYEDDIWGSICEQSPGDTGSRAGVIVLRHADAMLHGALAELLEAVDIYGKLATSAGDPNSGLADRMDLYIILTGTGTDFPVPQE